MKERLIGMLVTFAVIVAAIVSSFLLYRYYEQRPWTRDGQVRANIVGVAPRVAGPIVNIPLIDNQLVKKGDLLFEIDPATYQATVDNSKAKLMEANADYVQKSQELERQTKLFQTQVVDQRDFQNAQDSFAASRASLAAAQADLKTAQLNLDYTRIFAPVTGYVTNMNTSRGTFVHAGEQLLALVDIESFWIAGYFKETQMQNIRQGDRARLHLMGHFWQPFEGSVHSVGWGIFLSNGSTVQLLPDVQQTIDWVRLPNRFPVRIQVEGEPPVPLRIGQTVSVALLPADATE